MFSHHVIIQKMNLPMSEKAVLIALAKFANKDGKCWPSQGKLAQIAGCSRSTAIRALNALKNRGLVDWIQVNWYSCHYELKLPSEQELLTHDSCQHDTPHVSIWDTTYVNMKHKDIKEVKIEDIINSGKKTPPKEKKNTSTKNLKVKETFKEKDYHTSKEIEGFYDLWSFALIKSHGKEHVDIWTKAECEMVVDFMNKVPEADDVFLKVVFEWPEYVDYLCGEHKLVNVPSQPDLMFLVNHIDYAMDYCFAEVCSPS